MKYKRKNHFFSISIKTLPKIIFFLLFFQFTPIHLLESKTKSKTKNLNKTLNSIHRELYQEKASRLTLKKIILKCRKTLVKFPNNPELYLYQAYAEYNLAQYRESIKSSAKGIKILYKKIQKTKRSKQIFYKILVEELQKLKDLANGRLIQASYRNQLKKESIKKSK